MVKNILFVCKHNLFRSKLAETYFNQINKNKKLKASSAGFIQGKIEWLTPLGKEIVGLQRKNLRKRGLDIKNSSKHLNINLLKNQDLIIIISNDLKNIFDEDYIKKNCEIRTWKIKDIVSKKDASNQLNKTIEAIMKKVENLVEELK